MRVNYGPPPSRGDGFRGARGGGGGYQRAGSDNDNRVYVGNLSWGVDNLALENLFSEQGKVLEAKVVYDRESGRSRGFGFVTYDTAEAANSAIESLNGVVSLTSILPSIEVAFIFFPNICFHVRGLSEHNVFVPFLPSQNPIH